MGYDLSGGRPGLWWRDLYAWEYWRFLDSAAPSREEAVSSAFRELDQAAKSGSPGQWWREGVGAQAAARMLEEHGLCVMEDFLPLPAANAIADVAEKLWSDGQMHAGRWVNGAASSSRGDSIVWVNAEDPLLAMRGTFHKPYPGQSSAGVPEMEPVLECLDTFVADVVAKHHERGRAIATRSHGMLTCYPAAEAAVEGSEDKWVQGHLRHTDNTDGNGQILTAILYFNRGWKAKDGGLLRFFESDPALQVRAEVVPKFNTLVAFWSEDLPHEVTPPSRDRFALTLWYLDQDKGPSVKAFAKAPRKLE